MVDVLKHTYEFMGGMYTVKGDLSDNSMVTVVPERCFAESVVPAGSD